MAHLRRAAMGGFRMLTKVVLPEQSVTARLCSSNAETISRSLFSSATHWVSHFSTEKNHVNHQSLDLDLSNEESKRRFCNRLLYRSKQRGFLELDLVLGNWVEEKVHSLDLDGFKSLISVLHLENPDLWKWLSGQEQPPEPVKTNPVFCAIHEKVMSNLNSYAAHDTRAIPGQPWVRGWDDINKGRDGPIAGNQ